MEYEPWYMVVTQDGALAIFPLWSQAARYVMEHGIRAAALILEA